MSTLKRIAKENKKQLAALAVIGLIGGGLSASFLILITKILSLDSGVETHGGLAFALICGLILLIRHFHRMYAVKVAVKISNTLRLEMADLIKSCSAEFRNSIGKSDLLVIVTQDVQTISQFILSIPLLLSNFSLILGAVYYIFYISEANLYLAMITTIIAGAALYHIIMKHTTSLFNKRREQHRKLLAYFDDLISGYKELKTKPRYGELIRDRHIKTSTQELASLQIQATGKHSYAMNINLFMIYFLIGYILFIYPHFANAPTDLGTIVTYIIVILFAAGPFEMMLGVFPQFKYASVSAKRINQLEMELVRHRESNSRDSLGSTEFGDLIELSLVNVVYSYAGENNKAGVIGPIDLTIKKGEILLITGKNGSGKSTLSKVINGLYTASSGDVYWNNCKLGVDNILRYRENYATVFSDYHLFNETCNVYELERQKNSEWLEVLGVTELVNSLLENITKTNEMSQGQKRRLAIFIMLIENRPVYIFDEPGADLDPDFKDTFYYEVVGRLRAQGKTVIIVSHDKHYFDIASRVIEMSDGKVQSNNICNDN